MAIEDLLNQLRANDRGGRIDVSKLSPEQRAQIRQQLIQQREAETAIQQRQADKLGRASQNNMAGTRSPGLRQFDTGRFDKGPLEQVPPEQMDAARARTNAAYAEPAPAAPKNMNDVYVDRYQGQPAGSMRAYPGEAPAQPPTLRERLTNRFRPAPEAPQVPAGGTNFVDVPEKPQMSLRQRAEFDTAVGMEQEALARKQAATRGLAQAKPGSKYAETMKANLAKANADIGTARGLQTEVQSAPRGQASATDTVAKATTSKKGAKQAANDVESMAKQKLKETVTEVRKGADAIADKAPEVKRGVKKVTDKIKKVTGGLGGKMKMSRAAVDKDLPKDIPEGQRKVMGQRYLKGARVGVNVLGVAGLADMTESVAYDLYHADGDVKGVFDKYKDNMMQFIEAKRDELADSEDGTDFALNTGKLLWDTLVVGAVAAIPSLGKKALSYGADLGLIDSPLRYNRETGELELPGLETTPTREGLAAQGLSAPEPPAPPPPPPVMGGPDADMSLPPEAIDSGIATSDLGGGKVGIQGLRGGGFGAIDATNAPGGATGFRERVNQSIAEGGYNSVSPERRAEAQADLGRVRRGIDAMRDLSATRLGVPVQYLDAVRSGQMTRREAALAGVRDEGLRSRYGDSPAELATAQAKLLEAQAGLEGTRSDQITQGQTFIENQGKLLGTQAYPNNPERQAQYASEFTTFAQSKLPEGTRFDQLDATEQEELKGEFALLDSLSRKGEGFLRSLNPFAPDITKENLTGTGQSILDTLRQQGTTFDIGDDNLNFTGRDSSGRPVQLTIEKEDLPPAARAYVERYISRLGPEQRAARGGLRF